MKTRKIAVVILVILMCIGICGCNDKGKPNDVKKEKEVTKTENKKKTLDKKEPIATKEERLENQDNIYDKFLDQHREYENYGLYDIDGDGVLELITLRFESCEMEYAGRIVFDVYTVGKNNPQEVVNLGSVQTYGNGFPALYKDSEGKLILVVDRLVDDYIDKSSICYLAIENDKLKTVPLYTEEINENSSDEEIVASVDRVRAKLDEMNLEYQDWMKPNPYVNNMQK